MRLRTSFVFCMFLGLTMATACGDDGDGDGTDNASNDGGPGNGDGGNGDGGSGADASNVGGECEAAEAQCNNCIDDDDDGLTDGLDPHCAGPLDNDEASFKTDIPGDNVDPKSQDCFFDGNSGKDQPCSQIPTCCLLGEATCAMTGDGEVNDGNKFGSYPGDAQCEALFQCYADNADNITCPAPVGCDCFSCCTVCNPDTNNCADIYIGPGSPAECDPDDIGEATMSDCLSCTQTDACTGGGCDDDPEDCILCPGQTEEDLPDTCNDMNECPGDQTECETSGDCGDGQYCSVGCCLNDVE